MMASSTRTAVPCTALPFTGGRLTWDRDGRDWPNREASRFVRVGGIVWHVQQMGQGPVLLLVHGTGASTHSWRGLAPLLAKHFTVIAPDLPGHGFTTMPSSRFLSLPGMGEALGDLLRTLDASPSVTVGHSAGAAILARMCLDGHISPRALFSLNGALLPLSGVAAHFFSPVAKILASVPPLPWFFGRLAANPGIVERLIDNTGSRLDPTGIALYRRLFSNPGHVAGTLGMMANWQLDLMPHDLTSLAAPLTLVVGDRDGTIPPADAIRVRALVPSASLVSLPGLGHLAHEEDPEQVAVIVVRSAGKSPRGRR
jgi:magnesium chelatase accessory protein